VVFTGSGLSAMIENAKCFQNADRGAQGKEAGVTRSDLQKPDDEGAYHYTDGVHAQVKAVKMGG
jgi:hypothetical protein